MANTRANKNPEKSKKQRVRSFTGKCSKCGKKGVEVVKVRSAQMCTKCLTSSVGRQQGSDVIDLLKKVMDLPTGLDTMTMPSLPPVG